MEALVRESEGPDRISTIGAGLWDDILPELGRNAGDVCHRARWKQVEWKAHLSSLPAGTRQ